MTTAAVQQFLARCVVDPPFLVLARNDLQGALSGLDLTGQERQEFLSLDLNRVRTFAGFVTKVQNNTLWHTFPYTRLLVDHYGLDLELFSAYQAQHQCDRADQVDRTERTRHFAAFFPGWVASIGATRYPGLLDLFQHERLWFEQRLALQVAVPDQGRPVDPAILDRDARAADRLVPRIRGLLLIESFRHDPDRVIQALQTGRRTLADLTELPRLLAYWGDRDSLQLRIFEVDVHLCDLLDRVDGRHTLGQLLPAGDPLRSALRTVVRRMAKVGVLTFHEGD
ncbi:hypothetical protein ACGFYQ_39795 [Streptomyces sp. NPDC048258]|uniref:hypothetical protein n=1 Tax=Streptomyces sp. NPDC048258 TaxID=3365527 RepID=UPI003717A25A